MNSKYLFELTREGYPVRIEGFPEKATIVLSIGEDTETVVVDPAYGGGDPDMAMSTRFIMVVGQFICASMGLPQGTLTNMLALNDLIDKMSTSKSDTPKGGGDLN